MPTIADKCKARAAIYACRTEVLDALHAAWQAAIVRDDLPLARDSVIRRHRVGHWLTCWGCGRRLEATPRSATRWRQKGQAAVVEELRRCAGEVARVRLHCARARSLGEAAEPAALAAWARELALRRFAHVRVQHCFSLLRTMSRAMFTNTCLGQPDVG